MECYVLPMVEGLLTPEDFIKICPKCIMSALTNPFAMADILGQHAVGMEIIAFVLFCYLSFSQGAKKTSHLNVFCQVDALLASLVQFQTSKEIILLQTAEERIPGSTHKSGEGALFLSFTSIAAIPGTGKDLPLPQISPNSYCTVSSNVSYYLFLRFLFPICCTLHPLPDLGQCPAVCTQIFNAKQQSQICNVFSRHPRKAVAHNS